MPKEHSYYVYILSSKKHGTLYIGVTNNLLKRIIEHKGKLFPGFTAKYNVRMLLYYEIFQYINDAIKRETILKTWKRKWKIELIEQKNKDWKDLFYEIFDAKEIEATTEYLLKEKRND